MTQPYGGAQLDIGRVISRTFSAIGGNLFAFLLFAVLLAGLPTVLVTYVTQQYVTPAVVQQFGYSAGVLLLVQLGSTVVLWLPSYMLIGAITHGSIVFLNGERAGIGESLGAGLVRMLPLLLLGLLSSFGTAFFLLLFIIPGLMAMVRWSVAGPALVAERAGVFESFARSGDLTRDNRWRIFWLFVIWMVVAFVIQLAVTAALGYVVGAMDSLGWLRIWLYYGILAIYTAVTSLIGAAGSAALYTELRTIKEGATTAELAKVFD